MPRDPRRWSPRGEEPSLLPDILKAANSRYPDEALSLYFDERTGEFVEGEGDSLARFIVIELTETYEPEDTDEEKLKRAIQVMRTALEELGSVVQGLAELADDMGMGQA